ncbi:MAG: hypothetical protein MMC33_003732 [Icmadophila ericetorum]|nr:hypothetical protein [Icmadophila ericetorum]
MMESPTHRQFNFSLYLTPTKNQKYLEMSPDAYLQSSPVKKKVSAIRQIVPDADRLTESKVEFVHRPVPGSNMANHQSRVVMADGRILAKVANLQSGHDSLSPSHNELRDSHAQLEKSNSDLKSGHKLLLRRHDALETSHTNLTTNYELLKDDRNFLMCDSYELTAGNYTISIAKHAIARVTKNPAFIGCFYVSPREAAPVKSTSLVDFDRVASALTHEQLEAAGCPRPEKYKSSLFEKFCRILDHKNYENERNYWAPLILWRERKTIETILAEGGAGGGEFPFYATERDSDDDGPEGEQGSNALDEKPANEDDPGNASGSKDEPIVSDNGRETGKAVEKFAS